MKFILGRQFHPAEVLSRCAQLEWRNGLGHVLDDDKTRASGKVSINNLTGQLKAAGLS